MTAPSEFDAAVSPLSQGITVLEASAGTGKTFAIAALWLRMVLELEIPQERILVLTYTDAAASELRTRIHQRLVDASRAVDGDMPSDFFLKAVLDRCRRSDRDLRGAANRLAQARADFDEAPIGTIHGFCHRVQRGRAFEAGASFSAQLNPNTVARNAELVRDWWMLQMSGAPGIVVTWAALSGKTVAELTALLDELDRRPGARRIDGAPGASFSGLAETMNRSLLRLQELWRRDRDTLHPFLIQRSTWVGSKGGGIRDFKAGGPALEECLNGKVDIAGLEALWNFSEESVRKYAKRAMDAELGSPWMLERRTLSEAASAWSAAWPGAFLDWAEKEIPRRQRSARQFSHGDLLTNLLGALRGPGGDRLADAIRSDFDAVLVDEFQDTDPVQWNIFQRLFAVPHRYLFLVGDPKQAIYGFRGADIFTYLDAVRRADRRHTLAVNWRTGAALVEKINQFWSFPPNPFVLPEIEFRSIRPSSEREQFRVIEADEDGGPFQVWTLDGDAESSDEKALRRMVEGLAGEVFRLLQGGARLESRPIRPADIAVLGESRFQLEAVAAALHRRGIPAVLPTRENVLASADASEFLRFLIGILPGAGESLLRGALANDLVGLNAETLLHLGQNEPEWIFWLDRVQTWRTLWSLHGPLALFRAVISDCRSSARWLTVLDGERRLTNFLHVAELLQKAALTDSLGPLGQVAWLEASSQAPPEGDEQSAIRLERDDDAVRLLTLHGSKGLEFPIVFCPFIRKSTTSGNTWKDHVVFHVPGSMSESVWDLGSPAIEENQLIARKERLAENLRLLYVGLTRASRRVYLGFEAPKKKETALGWWLNSGSFPTAESWLRRGPGTKLEPMNREVLEQWAAGAGVVVRDVPEPSVGRWVSPSMGLSNPCARPFTRELVRSWRMTSFSGLAGDSHEGTDDHDPIQPSEPVEVAPTPDIDPSGTSISSFPRGREAGTCLHRILELHSVGSLADATSGTQLESVLAEYGIGTSFRPAVETLLREVDATPLSSEAHPFTLSEVQANDRLVELEFLLPLKRFTLGALSSVVERHADELPADFSKSIASLDFPPVEGLMRGFIDLVFRARERFWVIDWKSNWLGWSKADYSQPAMAAEMTARLYPLQVLLYALAVDRWLELRMPGYSYERDFGGIHYLFLRGLDASQPGQGVYSLRPSTALLRELGELLLESPGGER